MNTITSEVLILGAGPAGIGAALSYADLGYKVLLLEAGRPYHKRFCPVDRQKSCKSCGQICNVISGFGGCIHYGDGAKLSKFPSGRRLYEILGHGNSIELSQKALDYMFNKGGGANFEEPSSHLGSFKLKEYPIAYISESETQKIIQNLYCLITNHPNIALYMGIEVNRIEPNDNIFQILATDKYKRGEVQKYEAQKVVVAVGRYGHRWWREEIRRLGLIHKSPTSSIGLRFECPSLYLLDASYVHRDLKTTFYKNDLKVKTFCFCAGPGGGQVKFTDYGEYTLLDGHVTPDAKLNTGNFALLVQLKDPEGEPYDFDWIKSNLINPYASLRKDRPGKPVVQWFPDFQEKILSCKDFKTFVEYAGFKTSLSDYVFANLASILPDDVHQAFSEAFLEIFQQFTNMGKGSDLKAATKQVAVIGLELESLWDELSVQTNMETSIPNLFACGDCNGVAQGILQSFVSGLASSLQAEDYHYVVANKNLTVNR